VIAPITAAAQPSRSPSQPISGILPDATVSVLFRKYVAPRTEFSPLAAWDAHLALGMTLFRGAVGDFTLGADLQTVGLEQRGGKLRVTGVGYLFSLAYERRVSGTLAGMAGINHFSSHLTRELDQQLESAIERGARLPRVRDPAEYNVPFVGIRTKLNRLPFSPAVEVVAQPVNLALAAPEAGAVRPLFVATRWSLWTGGRHGLTAETAHEVGRRGFNDIAVFYRVADDRLSVFVSVSPGRGAHVSPRIGGLRDGLAAGLRIAFRSLG
jgi:hypothetical protein